MEIVGTNMGFCVIEDLLRRTAADQFLQNKAVPEVLSAGVQLAVGKGPGAALSELNVAGEVQLSGGPEALHIGSAVLHAAAPLQQNGPCACSCQYQRGKQARRSRTHHHRRYFRRGHRLRELIDRPGGRLGNVLVPAAAEHGSFVRRLNLHGVDHADALTGVDAAAENVQRQQVLFGDPQNVKNGIAQGERTAAGREFQIFDAQHGGTSCFDSCIVPQGRKKKNV